MMEMMLALNPGVRLVRNPETGVCLVYLPTNAVIQLSDDLTDFCLALAQRPASFKELLFWLSASFWQASDIQRATIALSNAGVICRTDAAPRQPAAKPQRWYFHKPFSLCCNVLEPARLCQRLHWLAAPLLGIQGLALSVAGVSLQLLFWLATKTSAAGHDDAGPVGTLAVLTLVLVVAMVHELGHGAVLSALGGNPTRMGLMLFFGAPALFCDISDSFRLPRRSQVQVSLAGVFVQAQLGAVLCLIVAVRDPWLAHHFAAVNLSGMLINLVPFIPLDGYFILRSGAGLQPNLRNASLEALRRTLLPRRTPLPHRADEPAWLPMFGFAAALCSVGALVLSAFQVASCLGLVTCS
jgi:putative peptide zinc metalloprotease protein